jgi:hypothetical protein
MKSFKQFLRECLLNERYDSLNAYRHSIGLPDEDTIGRTQDAIWLGHIAVEDPKKNQGIQSSVEDEARRRIRIEDDLMTPVEPPRDTDTFIRQNKLTQKIIDAESEINSRKPNSKGLYPSTQTVNLKRLQSTMDNIVNDRKAQFPDLAKEQEELDWKREKLKQKSDIVGDLSLLFPPPVAAPKGPAKITNYFKNLLNTEVTKIGDDISDNTKKQEQMPFDIEYGRFENKYGIPVIPQDKPEFEQTRKFTTDPALALPQENEQGIRLGRVDYSRKNK